MILDKGFVRQAGNPNDLVKTLPGNGAAIQLEFDIITPQLLKKLDELPDAQFIVRRGRNAINIFTSNPQRKISEYMKLLYSWELSPQQIGIIMTDFTDFFLVKPWEKDSRFLSL
jgi:hypothetical protein